MKSFSQWVYVYYDTIEVVDRFEHNEERVAFTYGNIYTAKIKTRN